MMGWIKLHKSLLDWEWFNDAFALKVWIWLLLKANYEDTMWRGISLKRGQILTSSRHMAAALDMSDKTVRNVLAKLQKSGEISITTDRKKGSLITISKYNDYQYDSIASAVITTAQVTAPTTAQVTAREEYKEYKNNVVVDDARACESLKVTWQNAPATFESMKARDQVSIIYMRSKMSPQEVARYLPEYYEQMKLEQKEWPSERKMIDHVANWMANKSYILSKQANGNSKQQQDAERKASIAASLASDLQYLSTISRVTPEV